MRLWRKVLASDWQPTIWTLRLECGHIAYRSAQYSRRELPNQVLCEACKSLIGSQVKNQLGTFGTIASYSDGLFDIEWNNSKVNRWTLEELREESEIL